MKQIIRRVAALVIGLGLGAVALAGLETVTHISDLNASWPLGSDLASTSDDHIRNIKSALKTDFPNVNGAVNPTPAQFNQLTTNTFTSAVTGNSFAPTSSTVPANGIYLPAANTLGFASNSTKWASVNSAGNWVFVAPTSGSPITIDEGAAGIGSIFKSSASNSALIEIAGNGNTAGTSSLAIGQDAAGAGLLVERNNSTLSLGTNGSTRVSIGAAGNITINAPTSGSNLTISQGSLGAGGVAGVLVTANSGVLAQLILAGNGATPATNSLDIFQNASSDAVYDLRANAAAHFYTNNTERLQISAAGALSGYGATAAALVDMSPDTSTFTATYTGFTAGVTCTATWSRVGKLVTLFFCSATGTSNATSFTMTGLPSAIQPAGLTQTVPLPIGPLQNGGLVDTTVSATVTAASGTVTFLHNGSASGWTSSSTKGFSSGATISYLLN